MFPVWTRQNRIIDCSYTWSLRRNEAAAVNVASRAVEGRWSAVWGKWNVGHGSQTSFMLLFRNWNVWMVSSKGKPYSCPMMPLFVKCVHRWESYVMHICRPQLKSVCRSKGRNCKSWWWLRRVQERSGRCSLNVAAFSLCLLPPCQQ